MTLKEAIASGRNIKCSHWLRFYSVEELEQIRLSVEEATSDQWTVLQEPLTSVSFDIAVRIAIRTYELMPTMREVVNGYTCYELKEVLRYLKKELGISEHD